MRKVLVFFAVAGALAAGLMAGGSASAATIESKPYIGVIGDLSILCPASQGAPTALGIGGNCFALAPADETAVVVVSDLVADNVGFQVGFYSASGARIGAFHPACNDGAFAVPNGAIQIRVFIDSVINGATDCEALDSDPHAGIGVIGQVGLVRLP